MLKYRLRTLEFQRCKGRISLATALSGSGLNLFYPHKMRLRGTAVKPRAPQSGAAIFVHLDLSRARQSSSKVGLPGTQKAPLAAGSLRKSAANTCSMPVHLIIELIIPVTWRQSTVGVKS